MSLCVPKLDIPTVSGNTFKQHPALKDNRLVLLSANIPNTGDCLWMGYPFENNGDGCAGNWVTFELENEKSIDLQGPWQISSTLFRTYSGIDFSDKCLSYLILAEHIDFPLAAPKIEDMNIENIVYREIKPIVGNIDRYFDIGTAWVKTLKKDLYFLFWRPGSRTSGRIPYTGETNG